MRTQAERTAAAESSMISAAISLLNSAGLQGTTLSAIGETAGYSRGLASHHFGTKAKLFRAVLRRISAAWSMILLDALGDRRGLECFAIAIDTHKDHCLAHPERIRAQFILWGAAVDPSSEFKPNVSEFMQIQRDSVVEWVQQGQADGEIHKDIDPERLAEQFYGGLIGINKQWLVSPDFDLATAYEDFKSNMVRLLSTDETKRTIHD